MQAVMWLACLLAAAPGDWQIAPVPIKTRWAADVRPDKPLPEYPRPQLVRARWQNLNGLWDYAVSAKDVAAAPGWEGKILVPFPVESALSGVKRKVDQNQRLWYRRAFTVPADWAGQRVMLRFGAVDWEATVSVNGQVLGTHRGGYDPFAYDVTKVLKPGDNELLVAVWDPSENGPQPRGKQQRGAIDRPGGIMYTPATGIWQTVWLEPLPALAIEGVVLTPDVGAGCLKVTMQAGGGQVEAEALEGGRSVGKVSGAPGAELKLPVPNARLWTPDSPFLYDLKLRLTDGGKVVDQADSYFAMRSTGLAKDDKGILRLLLNGKECFMVGPLDQGFWPDGIYTAPTDEALRYDIEITKKLGFNCARKHVKVEPDRWYYWCDKLGLLVWQDMPSGGAGDHRTDKRRSDAAATQFETELKAMLDSFRNHPSIVMWVVFNEGWGQYDTPRLTEWVKQYDPSRLVNNASGWTDRKCGDVIDMHNYPGPGSPKPEETRAAVLGEFGGLGLTVPDHTWAGKGWGYRGSADPARLTRDYARLLRRLHALRTDAGLCAGIYTQTTDVEMEHNGLLTYDRAIVKPDLAIVAAAAARGEAPPDPVEVTVVATSEREAQTWRYSEQLADGWFQPGFDDKSWRAGPGGFGTRGTPGSVVRTEWKGKDLWLRRTFTLDKVGWRDLQLRLHHDEDAEVYLNGVLACKVEGYTSEYGLFLLGKEALAALKTGANTLAVHVKQTMGGQYIDVGLVDVVPPK